MRVALRGYFPWCVIACACGLMLVVGCGGGTGSNPSGFAAGDTLAVPPPPAGAGDLADPVPGWPQLPDADYGGPYSPMRHASATLVTLDGMDWADAGGASNYQPPETEHYVIVADGADPLAYAIYVLADLDLDRPVDFSFTVSAAPGEPGGGEDLPLKYYVAVSNYSKLAWDWYGPFTAADQVVLNSDELYDRCISAGHALSVLVATALDSGLSSPGNPEGMTAACIEVLGFNLESAASPEYHSTRPHFAELLPPEGKQAAALDPAQYVTLNWEHVTDPANNYANEADFYEIRRAELGEEVSSLMAKLGAHAGLNSYVDDGTAPGVPPLKPGQTYIYYLRAENEYGYSSFDQYETTIPLLPPTGLTASYDEYTDRIELSWLPSEGAESYDIYRDSQEAEPLASSVETVYTDSAVSDGAEHTYWIKAINVYAASDFSMPATGRLLKLDPLASLTADPEGGAAPLTVEFDAAASYDPDNSSAPGAGIVKYEFDFGEGGGWEDYGTTPSAEHTYANAGRYLAQLRVTDDDGAQATASAWINGAAPLAVLEADPQSGPAPLTVSFDGSASSDPDGGALVLYEWDWDGDGSYDFSGTGATAQHIYDTTGNYTAVLRVTDDEGDTGTASQPVSVGDPPTPASLMTVPDRFGSEIDELLIVFPDPVVRRDPRVTLNPLSGQFEPDDANAYNDILKTNGDEFALDYDPDASMVYPAVGVQETADPAYISSYDDPQNEPGIVIVQRNPGRIVLDIAVITLPGSPGDPERTYSFRLFDQVGVPTGEGSFVLAPINIDPGQPNGVRWAVNAWDRESFEIADRATHFATYIVDGTTVPTNTPPVLWVELNGGWVYDFSDPQSPATDNIKLVLTDNDNAKTAELLLTLCIAGLDVSGNCIFTRTVTAEDFVNPVLPGGGPGNLNPGHEYLVALDGTRDPGIDYEFSGGLLVVGTNPNL